MTTSSKAKAVREWRNKTKLRMIEAFGSKCATCGYSRCIAALEFHHLDPTKKEFGPGALRASSSSWQKICDELRKCVMLCANCHREFHAGLLQIPDDAPRFDESYVEYKENLKCEKLDKCPVCAANKPKYQITCSKSCASRHRNKIDWSLIDLEQMKRQGLTNIAIGDMLGVSDVSVRKRLIKLGLFDKFKHTHKKSV